AITEIAMWSRLFRDQPEHLMLMTKAKDIAAAKASGKIGIIYGFQNTSAIGSDLKRIDMFHDFGLRVIQLTYNDANPVAVGAAGGKEPGLTPFGREMVAGLNDKKIIVDLSHSNYRTCLDAVAASKAPIAISHTGCAALYDIPRNKTDEELRAVAEKGGYVGIYFVGGFMVKGRDATAEDVVAHIEHAINVCGEDHVGIGTDNGLDPAKDIEEGRKALAKRIEQRRAEGISAAGEIPGMLYVVPDLTGPEQFRRLADTLARRGHSARRIEKILGANFVRYAAGVWGS
ncbi:MAG: dipeptidase, partial [Novosphingobium sp.]